MVIHKKSTAHETSHALKHESEFKVEARRNKLVGLWAAEKMNLTGDAAAVYAREVVSADMEEAGIDDVVRKVMADFAGKGVAITENQLRDKLNEQLPVARRQIIDESEKAS
ncbi:MAG: hypothetical protein A3G18_02760 [Rhodospirillales bacterium RIFCSPLOWO2_12_FULL_58_28]|nr:MAG: hypothetical protein A3H92_00725 [Rhodospirillales bacterium RIFCSPLOWO2_02_FULL_58_16]OHC77087.1 MAG: hypothetical protein A3G18_02760 [Rhodospirillales bacterium RIFCSPLOWO2_12_FULL_58_28]